MMYRNSLKLADLDSLALLLHYIFTLVEFFSLEIACACHEVVQNRVHHCTILSSGVFINLMN